MYSLLSIGGFVLIVIGFGQAREHAQLLYVPPVWLRHVNALFTLTAFVLVAAAYVPRNHVKAAIGHPMLAGVKIWALGHLLAAGMDPSCAMPGAGASVLAHALRWLKFYFLVARAQSKYVHTRSPRCSCLTCNSKV